MNDSSQLLIDEPPMQVLPSLAEAIGLNQAIVLQQIHYWLRIRKRDGDERYRHNGRWWIYNSLSEWSDQFSWWSKSTIRRIVDDLVSDGLIEKRLEGESGKQTTWYTIDYSSLAAVTSDPCQNDTGDPCQSEGGTPVKMTEPPCQNDTGGRDARDTETTTETEQTSSSTQTRADIPEKRPDLPQSDSTAGSDDDYAELRETAQSFDLDVEGRKPVEERDGAERLGLEMMMSETERILGEYWDPFSKPVWLRRLRVITTFWSASEIRDALSQTAKWCTGNSWGYFREVLNGGDDRPDVEQYESERERLRAQGGFLEVDGGGSDE